MPKGWEQFGYPHVNDRGERMFFRITGNMPGRQDADKVWSEQYTCDLLGWGFTQSLVGRRVFYKFDAEGKARVVGVFAGGNWALSQSPTLHKEYVANWLARFEAAPGMAATEGDFCGVGSARVDEDTVELRVDKAIDDLASKL